MDRARARPHGAAADLGLAAQARGRAHNRLDPHRLPALRDHPVSSLHGGDFVAGLARLRQRRRSLGPRSHRHRALSRDAAPEGQVALPLERGRLLDRDRHFSAACRRARGGVVLCLAGGADVHRLRRDRPRLRRTARDACAAKRHGVRPGLSDARFRLGAFRARPVAVGRRRRPPEPARVDDAFRRLSLRRSGPGRRERMAQAGRPRRGPHHRRPHRVTRHHRPRGCGLCRLARNLELARLEPAQGDLARRGAGRGRRARAHRRDLAVAALRGGSAGFILRRARGV